CSLPGGCCNVVFFFQAEDGIRDFHVTGVQTCALPIFIDATIHLIRNKDASIEDLMQYVQGPDFPTGASIYGRAGIHQAYTTGRRAEERRVGKECSSRRSWANKERKSVV